MIRLFKLCYGLYMLPSEGYLTEEETQTGEKNIEEQISDFFNQDRK